MSFRVRGIAADVDALRKLALEGLRLDAVAMNELVLLEDVSEMTSERIQLNFSDNLTFEDQLGSVRLTEKSKGAKVNSALRLF